MKLITLAKRLDFTEEWEYFYYLVDSYINGNFSQCERLFKEMSKADRKRFLLMLSQQDKFSVDYEAYEYYFDLL